jgi:hypothetical protein
MIIRGSGGSLNIVRSAPLRRGMPGTLQRRASVGRAARRKRIVRVRRGS